MGTKTEARPQKREAWGMLRKLPSKRWQARYVGPDDKVYSARTEDDKPLTLAWWAFVRRGPPSWADWRVYPAGCDSVAV